jgi:predicted transcriptional regulator
MNIAGKGIDFLSFSCYFYNMTTKEKMMRAVQSLPEDASFEDAMERLLFLAKIDKGLQEADSGKGISHAKVKEKMKKWLK